MGFTTFSSRSSTRTQRMTVRTLIFGSRRTALTSLVPIVGSICQLEPLSDQSFLSLPLNAHNSSVVNITTPSPLNTSVLYGCRQEKGDHGNAQTITILQNITNTMTTAAANNANSQSFTALQSNQLHLVQQLVAVLVFHR